MCRICLIVICLILGAGLDAQKPDAQAAIESGKPRLAILNFEVRGTGLEATLGASIADLIATKLMTPDYQIIERSQMANILRQRQLQLGDIIDAAQAQKLQQALGAEYVMVGSIEKIGNGPIQGSYRVVKVENLEVQPDLKDNIADAVDEQDFRKKICESLEHQTGYYEGVCRIAKELADKIAGELCSSLSATEEYSIAVFPFGDSEELATNEMGLLPIILQSELSDLLRKYLIRYAKGGFAMLDREQLAGRFKPQKISPEGINPQKIETDKADLFKRLQKADIQVAVIGHYKVKDLGATDRDISVEAFVVVEPDQKITKYQTQIKPTELVHYSGLHQQPLSGRLGVEFWIAKENKKFDKPNEQLKWDNTPENWEKLPLYECSKASSSYANVRFLKLTKAMRGKRYKIRLINRGTPEIEKGHPLDADRLFAAALAIDGANSFYQKRANGTLGPVIVHPEKAQKWILTAPGRMLEPSSQSFVQSIPESAGKRIIKHGMLRNVKGLGHSQTDVRGFQKSKLEADAFVFKSPKESVAECLNITTEIGLITVHFYTEKLPFVQREGARATGIGSEIPSRVHHCSFPMEKEPCEVIRIFYRYENRLPEGLTDDDLTLCKP